MLFRRLHQLNLAPGDERPSSGTSHGAGTKQPPTNPPQPNPASFDGPTLDMPSADVWQSGVNRTIDWQGNSGSHSSFAGPDVPTQHALAQPPSGSNAPPATPITRLPVSSAIGSVHGQSTTGAPSVTSDGLPIIDGYNILRRAGKGGMGEVFEATQLATGRRVAIKLLPEAALINELARQRFAREVEVIARLSHPGIVPIIDSGVRKGLYFYVMDFVEGESLDQVLPPGKCDHRKAIETMIAICESVDYAHQRGVLHRDLKPSNVIVDKQGRPHLLDFGLAKQTGDSSSSALTPENTNITIAGAGQLLGTVAFMSPEQAAGNANLTSVRSDIYSLGVMGYLLLTGKLPISMTGSLREVLTWIAEKEPTPPSKIVASFGRDIDAIFLKSLEKQPDARYATAGEFAADLKRYLNDEPILARPVSPTERAIRWTRRNKTLSATIAAAVVTLTIVSGTLVSRIITERDRANVNAEESKKNAEKAQAKAIEASENANRASDNEKRAVDRQKELTGALQVMNDILSPVERRDRGEFTVLDMLNLATNRLNRTPLESKQTEAVVRENLATVYLRLGRYKGAKENYEKAFELRKALVTDDAETRLQLATTMHSFAATLWWLRDFQSAEALYIESLKIRRESYSGNNPEISTSLMHLSACLLNMDRVDEAHEYANQALTMRKQLFGDKHELVAQALNSVAKTDTELEDYANAEKLYQQAFDMIVELKGRNHGGSAATAQNLAQCLFEQGKFEQARERFQQALDIRKDLFQTSSHPLIANTMVGLARTEITLGNPQLALQLATEATTTYNSVKYEGEFDLADADAVRGEALIATGDMTQGLEVLNKAVKSMQDSTNPPKVQFALVRAKLGEVLNATGKHADAIAELTAARSIAVEARGAKSKLVHDIEQRLDKVRAK